MQSPSSTRSLERRPASRPQRTPLFAAAGVVIATALFVAVPPASAAHAEGAQLLGRLHPLAVHLPIGVVLLVAFAEALTMSRRFGDRCRRAVDPPLGAVLGFLLAAMLVAFTVGALLASGGDYPPRLVSMHRALGLAAVIGTAVSLVAWHSGNRRCYRVALFATVAVVTAAAHYGGSITHGDGYLTRFAPTWLYARPAAPPIATAAPATEQPRVFDDVVLPMLVEHCAECHGARKASAGLRLDSFAALQKGSEDGPVVIANSSAQSPLVQRMTLPAADDQHMPPGRRKGPTAEEVALLNWWIDRGASQKLPIDDALPPPGARAALENQVQHR